MTNGDKLVLKKLDDQISVVETNNDDDEIDEIEYKKVSIDYTGLLDKNCSQDNILKDLLDLPLKNTSKVSIHSFILIINLMKIFPNLYQILHHPVMIMFIERRWMKTKWLFLISFLLYLLFLILLSTFFGLMYFREGAKPAQTLTFEDAARECKGIMQRIGKSSYSLQCQALH